MHDDHGLTVSNSSGLIITVCFTPPPGGSDTKAKDSPSTAMAMAIAEVGADGGGAKTAPQSRNGRGSRGSVTGAAEGRTAESRRSGGGSSRSSWTWRRGEDGAEVQDDPQAAGEGATKAERAGVNEADVERARTAQKDGMNHAQLARASPKRRERVRTRWTWIG